MKHYQGCLCFTLILWAWLMICMSDFRGCSCLIHPTEYGMEEMIEEIEMDRGKSHSCVAYAEYSWMFLKVYKGDALPSQLIWKNFRCWNSPEQFYIILYPSGQGYTGDERGWMDVGCGHGRSSGEQRLSQLLYAHDAVLLAVLGDVIF